MDNTKYMTFDHDGFGPPTVKSSQIYTLEQVKAIQQEKSTSEKILFHHALVRTSTLTAAALTSQHTVQHRQHLVALSH
jgi:hypothetical protein